MAKRISIPITDHNTGGICTSSYGVRFRLTGSSEWQDAPTQYDTPVIIDNLDADTEYDYEVTRTCCGGLISTAATGTYTTSA